MTTDLQKTPRERIEKIDRLPPSSVESEQGVLGCVLLSPNDCMGECIEKLKAGPEVFYDLRHQTLLQTLTEMYDQRAGIDLITLQQRLKDRQQLDAVGGLAYLASLPDAVPTAAGLDYYLDIVLEKYLLRKMVQTCSAVVGRIMENDGQADELLDEAERDILAVAGERAGGKSAGIMELVHEAIADMEASFNSKGAPTGVTTGFVDLDKMTSGLQNGDMVVIAARPSVGKTSLAMNIAEHVAVIRKLPVGVFSLEMAARQLTKRMVASLARVNLRSIADGFLAERDLPKLTGAAGRISSAPLHIDDSSGLSIMQLRAKARRLHQQHKVKLFIVDYLQLLHSSSRKVSNREQEIADISGGLKSLAKELDVPVVVLSQLNRDLEKRKGDRPRLFDLRESGAIEQDADFVGMLYRPHVQGEGDEAEESEQYAIPVDMAIEKQRNGPTGTIHFTFLKQYTRFESAAKVSLADIPNDNDRNEI